MGDSSDGSIAERHVMVFEGPEGERAVQFLDIELLYSGSSAVHLIDLR